MFRSDFSSQWRCGNLHGDMKYVFAPLLAVFLLISFSSACAQSASVPFQPGEWQINSIVTPSMGKAIQRQTSVCAKSAAEAWQANTPTEKCTAPTLTSIANGYHATIECSGDTGPVQWKSDSSVDEMFSDSGKAFDAHGTATTTVSYSGHAPVKESATIHATGKRMGDCK